MKLTRHHALQAIGLGVLLAAALWVTHEVRWVDVDVDDPPDRALRLDPLLRLKHLLTRVGMQVVTPDNLDRLPPPDAELILASWDWTLFPERDAALRRWVASGGTLVVPFFGDRDAGLAWIPAEWSARHDTPAAQATGAADERPAWAPCRGLDEPAGVTPAFDIPRGYATCLGSTAGAIRGKVAPQWALDGPSGHVVLRVPYGSGSVTVAVGMPWDNDAILERDNALIALATLQAHPGRVAWLLTTESRPPLLSFLWQRGSPAVLLGVVALACGLWRGASRFGPRLATPPLLRRSMADQIRGTASFIARSGSPALHAAQLRALHEAAAPRVRGYDHMSTRERAQAFAALTGVDSALLAQALQPGHAHPPPAWLAALEITRRRTLASAYAPSFSEPEPHDPGT